MWDGRDVQITIVCDVHVLPQFSFHCLKFSIESFLLFIFKPPRCHRSHPNILKIYRIRHCGLFSIKSWNFSDYFFDFQFRVFCAIIFTLLKELLCDKQMLICHPPAQKMENFWCKIGNFCESTSFNTRHSFTFIFRVKLFHLDNEFCRIFIQILSSSPPFT